MTIWQMYFACWISKLQTHPQYVILIVFPLQIWLHERAATPPYTYIACLVHIALNFTLLIASSSVSIPLNYLLVQNSDYFLVIGFKNCVLVWSDCDTDHYLVLVVAKVRESLAVRKQRA
jgi:hypothetical protein